MGSNVSGDNKQHNGEAEVKISAEPNEADEDRRSRDPNIYFNSKFKAKPSYLEPGNCLCGDHMADMIVATPGEGIILTLYDKHLKVGGAAYLVLPEPMIEAFPDLDQVDEELLSRAFTPVEQCVRMLKQYGAGKNRIRARLIGSSDIPADTQDRGAKNFVFVKEYLGRQGLQIASEDVGGSYLRRLHFFPYTGHAVRLILRRDEDFIHAQEVEKSYKADLESQLQI